MNVSQSDIKVGLIPLNCGEDLTGLEGRLVKLAAGPGPKAEALLPTANTDITPFLCVSGDEEDQEGSFQPFTGEQNHRVRANGLGSAGDRLVLADTATPADKGKVRALPAAPGTYEVIAIAEEDFVDEQLVKCRPIAARSVTVG